MFRTARTGPTFAALGLEETPQQVVDRIAESRARDRRRFRLAFVATWLILVGGLIAAIGATGRVHPDFMLDWAPFILGGVSITILVSVLSIFFATIFAVVGALGRLSRAAPIYATATLYVSLVRGTPLIIQLIFWYLALPQFGIVLPGLVCGIFGLAFNYGAYMTEIFRAGIQAIPRGQIEAAAALGMTERLTMRRIVLPQATRIVIPAIGNEFIAMIKDSALVAYVGIQETYWRASTTGSRFFRSFETLLVAALIYWLLTIVFSLVQERIERRLSESDVRL
jgi:polar amino acid transport system permease protein